MFKKKNYKLLIGIIIGIIISVSIVYAATYTGTAADLSYDNSTSGLSSSNVQDALDELYNKATCPEGYHCEKLKTELELGDYVSYTPIVTSYSTDTTKTGYSSSQTIYPSELNLWRVLNINNDGTVDLISEYVSSTDVYFQGQTGYQNFVGYLNVLASQYETEGVTKGSRHFGYNGQTEYITDTSMFTTTAPWTCSTGDTCDPDPDDYESKGGGDTLYEKDYNQVRSVLGSSAVKVGTTTMSSYWMASRHYEYDTSGFYYALRYLTSVGSFDYNSSASVYKFQNNGFVSYSPTNALRPIVTLKAGINYEGFGTKWYPMEIKAN